MKEAIFKVHLIEHNCLLPIYTFQQWLDYAAHFSAKRVKYKLVKVK